MASNAPEAARTFASRIAPVLSVHVLQKKRPNASTVNVVRCSETRLARKSSRRKVRLFGFAIALVPQHGRLLSQATAFGRLVRTGSGHRQELEPSSAQC